MIGYIFLFIILVIVGITFLIMEGRLNKEGKKRNAWDIMFFNTILAIVVLFMIGLLENSVWGQVVYTLGAVAVGSGIAGIFKARREKE